MKCCIYIFVLFLALTQENVGGQSIIQERPCVTAGGRCLVREECPKGDLSEKPGLCPRQRRKGVECCYGVSVRETRCEKRGGVCMSRKEFCNRDLVFKGAMDCRKTQKCCIMV